MLRADYFCILPDLPGHGKTSVDHILQRNSFDAVAEGAIKLLDELALKKTTLIGYSMGGRLALYTYLKFPERFSAIVLESSNPGIESDDERALRARADDERARQLKREGLVIFVKEWYQMPLFASLKNHPEKMAQLQKKRAKLDPNSTAAVLRRLSVGRQPSHWDQLGEIGVPTLILTGALDRKYGQIARRMTQMIRHAEWKVIADAGHITHLEQPTAFGEALRRFLSRE
jgi:2-succinyl-6-hydroxy-2,4-cyclohexadiene-1-carboxylate synthase